MKAYTEAYIKAFIPAAEVFQIAANSNQITGYIDIRPVTTGETLTTEEVDEYINSLTAPNYQNVTIDLRGNEPRSEASDDAVAELDSYGTDVLSERVASYVYILDGYSPLTALAFVLLSSTYAGPLVNIRRSSDDATKDFYPDVNNILSLTSEDGAGTSLSTWIGSDDGYIVTLYDQSGNGYNHTNATTTLQPKIIAAGALLVYDGIVSGFYNGDNVGGLLNSTYHNSSSSNLIFQVFRGDGIQNGVMWEGTSAGMCIGIMQDGSASAPDANVGTPTYYNNGSVLTTPDRNALFDAFLDTNRHLVSIFGIDFTSIEMWKSNPFVYSGGNSLDAPIYFQLHIMFNTDQSANRADIEDRINTFYSIYS